MINEQSLKISENNSLRNAGLRFIIMQKRA